MAMGSASGPRSNAPESIASDLIGPEEAGTLWGLFCASPAQSGGNCLSRF